MNPFDLLLEIGTEEIPHDLLEAGITGLKKGLTEGLKAARLDCAGINVDGTPRRLSAIVRGLPQAQSNIEVTAKGPSTKVAMDAEGKPTKAGEGFARGQKASFADLTVVDGYMVYKRQEKGQPSADVLATLLPQVLTDLHWAKAMRWGNNEGPFVRPIKWICAVADGAVVPFEFARVRSANQSFGHRFMAPSGFTVTSPDDYLSQLADAKVVLKRSERIARITQQVAAEATKANGTPEQDAGLILATALKTEWPVAVLGSFDDVYLKLPKEVLLTSMKEHQDDFGVVNADGKLMANFVAVADNQATNMAVVAKGNERVLRARLEDARFFYNEDQKQPLKGLLPKLDTVMFQKQLGSVGDKVRRVATLTRAVAEPLGDVDNAVRAAELCKADLVSNMVGEFPELQGIMGHAYALADGEPAAAALAIEEHYLPRSAGDDLPQTAAGTAVALADKLDTLVAIFGVGLIPSGSQDPYALRRQGLGVMRMLLAQPKIDLSLLVPQATAQLADTIERDPNEVSAEVLRFLGQRLQYLLTQDGMRQDIAAACVAAGAEPASGFSNVADTRDRACALDSLCKQDDFDDLMTSVKRIMKIIPKDFSAEAIDASLLQDGPERDLSDAFDTLSQAFSGRASEQLEAMQALKPTVDAFFDAVLVNDPDEKIRTNRLSMLAAIRESLLRFADFSLVSS